MHPGFLRPPSEGKDYDAAYYVPSNTAVLLVAVVLLAEIALHGSERRCGRSGQAQYVQPMASLLPRAAMILS
jgi:hypothetical protein